MKLNGNTFHPTLLHTRELLSIQEQRGRCLPFWTQFSSFHFQHHIYLPLSATGEFESCEGKQVGRSGRREGGVEGRGDEEEAGIELNKSLERLQRLRVTVNSHPPPASGLHELGLEQPRTTASVRED